MPDENNTANQDQNTPNLDAQNQNNNQSAPPQGSDEEQIQNLVNQVAGNQQPTNPPQDDAGQNKQTTPKPVVEETSAPPPPTPPSMDGSEDLSPPAPPTPSPGEDEQKNQPSDQKETLPPPPPGGGQNSSGDQPPGGIPPVVTSPKPKKKRFGGKKMVATILGILFLVGGIGAGVYLVQQQQDIREEAYESYDCREDCFDFGGSAAECSTYPPCGDGDDSPTTYDCREDCFDFGGSAAECSTYPPCDDGSSEPNACDRSAPSVAPGPEGEYCTDKTFGSSCQTRDGQSGSCQPIGDPNLGTQVECKCAPGGQSESPISSSTPSPRTPPPGTQISCRCQLIRTYDQEWNELSRDDLVQLEAGDVIMITVSGETNSGAIDMARFTINGEQRPAVTQKSPVTGDFFDEYTIPEDTTSFSINAELHHTSPQINWF